MSFLKWFTSRTAGAVSISIVLFLLLFFGLIPQDGGRDGFWGMIGFRSMKNSPIFIAALIFLAICLVSKAADDLIHFRSRSFAVTCVHTCVAVILTVGLLSIGTTVRANLSLSPGVHSHTATDVGTGATVRLPFELMLMKFNAVDYAANLALTLPDGKNSEVCIKVNHPLKNGRWWVYLTDYTIDTETKGYLCNFRCTYSPVSWIFGIALWLVLLSAAAMIAFAGFKPVPGLPCRADVNSDAHDDKAGGCL